jgi:hypothetical protein
VDRQTVVIRLELHLADDALTGRASDGTGPAREFAGWMGLVAAIDALVRRRSQAPKDEDSTTAADEGEAS